MQNYYWGLTIVIGLLTSCSAVKKEAKLADMQAKIAARQVDVADVQVPNGYKVEVVATGLTFPVATTFDDKGDLYVIETGYSYGGDWETPKLIRLGVNGQRTTIATGEKNGPWSGVTYYQGNFYISEGGRAKGGKILKVTPSGQITALVENIPSMGDHFTNGPVIGRDGYLYFSNGTATNSGVAGEDSYKMGWLSSHQEFHDVPCRDIELIGDNFTSENPLTDDKSDKAHTGAFVPFNTTTAKGQVIKGQVPCSGAVYKIKPEGGQLELVAWGFRNPFGLAIGHNGELVITENGFDIRGSRPVRTNGDHLWIVQPGTWYGWPDFQGGKPVNNGVTLEGEQAPKPLLARYPNTPPKPLTAFPVHSSADGIDIATTDNFGQHNKAFVALFGDMTPMTGAMTSHGGHKVVMVNMSTGEIEDFMTNKGKENGPASELGTKGLERPVGVKLSPDGKSLYVTDFGILKIMSGSVVPKEGSGVVWKVTKQ